MQTEGKNERAETRYSQSRKRTLSSKVAKEIHKKRETVHERTWNENKWQRSYNKKLKKFHQRIVKEQWLDKLCHKMVKLEKYIEKRKWKEHNIMFQRDQKGFFQTPEEVEKWEGEMSEMQRFVEFWGGIWEQNEPTPNMPWMEEVKAEVGERANLVSEFAITDENMKK